MLLLIDNYDSFTYNLVHYFEQLDQDIRLFQHDEITLEAIEQLNPCHIVLSPGPKAPKDAGICLDVVRHFYQTKPILGICLGHQVIAEAFGARIIRAPHIIHGKTSEITHHQQGLFQGIPQGFLATRYHSLMIETETLPEEFSVDAWAGDIIMAISHRQYPIYGVQFHPEAILTEYGLPLLQHFIDETS
jgi:anthranilate synthase/aminodeoxychorismate synthase-like glutamine amidotransferase